MVLKIQIISIKRDVKKSLLPMMILLPQNDSRNTYLLFEDSGPKPANLDGQYNYI
jgi:hypothetical protein